MTTATKLFAPAQLGPLTLQNHIVMAPMTRSRAYGNVPNALMAEYYAQRASAGLIVTEGTAPAPAGLGYARIPGLYSDEQVAGWRLVTDAVHQRGGRIFVQLMHTGRVGHSANLPQGAEIIAPSSVAAAGDMWTDEHGMQPHPAPRELSTAEVRQLVQEFVRSARQAVAAGFDGVELHGANGYLLEQFLHPGSNQRTDEYGGSVENRARFVLEVAQAVGEAIGFERTGIRLSPYGVFNDMPHHDAIDATYSYLAKELQRLGLVYLHLVDHAGMGAPAVPAAIVDEVRARFHGTLILSGNFTAERAEQALQSGLADLVAFGRPFVSNPDLVERFRTGAELTAPDPSTFYTPGEKGYTDYPVLVEQTATTA